MDGSRVCGMQMRLFLCGMPFDKRRRESNFFSKSLSRQWHR